jgi:uncharacterized membrane protein
MTHPQTLQRIALICIGGLMATMAYWLLVFAKLMPPHTVWLWLAGVELPLLLAVPGLLAGRPYTFAWLSLASLFYFGGALTDLIANPAGRHASLPATLLALGVFGSCVLFPKALKAARQTRR